MTETLATLPTPLPGSDADVLMWARPDEIEDAALAQLRNVAALPWVAKLRVMPDVHFGKGATVGSVIAMRGAVAPSAVGVDIGCGMQARPLNLTVTDLPDDLGSLRSAIEAATPVGWRAHDGHAPALDAHARLGDAVAAHQRRFTDLHHGVGALWGRALAQCGTLGGGNHFIELCADEQGGLWLMLHSGSRNIGRELAERHIGAAKTLEHNLGLPDRDLAVFLAGTAEMDAYLHDLHWAQDYALLNRRTLMATVVDVTTAWGASAGLPPIEVGEEIACHHNYVAHETYDGVDVVVTRKGRAFNPFAPPLTPLRFP